MMYQFLKTPEELAEWLKKIENTSWIGLDTEFISEGKFTPLLCLIQIATEEGLFLIDALSVGSLRVFWERICREDTLILVHACRSEMEFCHHEIGRIPRNVFDIQLAAGFAGSDYPSGFKSIGEHFANIILPKAETRTNWQKRPLSMLQIDYALNDVCYLHEIASGIRQKLKETKRLSWFQEEMSSMLDSLLISFEKEDWTELPGILHLTSNECAVAKALWDWRRHEAESRNRPECRILRDDLIVELAKRKTADPERIGALRGMQYLQKSIPRIAEVIAEALSGSDVDLPEPLYENSFPQYSTICQFIRTALSDFSRKKNIALSLIASPRDIREYIASYYKTLPKARKARLRIGWRKKLLGPLLKELMSGNIAIRLTGKVDDPIEIVSVDHSLDLLGEDSE
ncbi:MAG: HRDC domain-containing protein [Planctomycetia bacterium]|nr:HRDC domain-containing protein [Planctomycetia bacterium]